MAPKTQKPHFVLFPLMAQGHIIPMVDIAKLLAQRGVKVTFITTPYNAARLGSTFSHETNSGLDIQVIQLPFPCEEAGLPEGCESIDLLPSLSLTINFFKAAAMMKDDLEKVLDEMLDPPSCIISSTSLPWTIQIAHRFQILRIVSHVVCCFTLLCLHSINLYKVHEKVDSETEFFVLPGLPDRVEFTNSQIPLLTSPEYAEFSKQMIESDRASYGAIINSFEELEGEYVKELKKASHSDKLWCVGPVSLGYKDSLAKSQRGNNKSAIGEQKCLEWLDKQSPCSVIYVCLGSLCTLTPTQLMELGLGLEASKRPFIWVIREGKSSEELKKWVLEEGFEERNKERCLVVFGWAPQLLILSHVAIGGFLTHCGSNSLLEGISVGVPLITWPLFGDHFIHEKFAVEILRIGVRVGIEKCVKWGEEGKVDLLARKERVKEAIDDLMDGEDREERRGRVRKFSELAKRAVEEGGSSYISMTLLIEDIVEQADKRKD